MRSPLRCRYLTRAIRQKWLPAAGAKRKDSLIVENDKTIPAQACGSPERWLSTSKFREGIP